MAETVRHDHLDDRPFVLVPLRLAGKACAPPAALAGIDPAHPMSLTVRQPRDRAERFGFVERLAALLLPYLEQGRAAEPETYTVGRGADKEEHRRPLRAPQPLVPNGEGIAYVRRHANVTGSKETTDLRNLPVVVSTAKKWSYVKPEKCAPWRWAIVDEAHQMRSDALLATAPLFGPEDSQVLFVGDPG
ncbi:hypothetical protein [Streptomyces sp. NBC_01635]|uniref:hypothetical protein n=1 Tax=Streptomyces sp. NBC_01635 TaxID=2975904 RepID=UPI00386E5A3D